MREAVFKTVLEFFKDLFRKTPRIREIDSTTKVFDFEDNIVTAKLDIIEELELDKPGVFTFEILLVSNGAIILRETYKGDMFIVKRICENFKFSLEKLLEGYSHDIRKNTRIKAFA